MERGASLKRLADQLRLQRMAPDAEPFMELMSDGFVWSDEKLHGLSTEEMGGLRAIFRFRTSLITQQADSRFENLWNELRKICPEWIGFDPSRCSPNETLLARYQKSRKRSPWDSLKPLQFKSSSKSVGETKQQRVAITLLLRARYAINIPSGELDELDADFHKSIDGDQPDRALAALEKIAEKVPCRGGFWRDLERAAFSMEMKDRTDYFRSRFLSTKHG
jgi:hypothetical protein